MDWMDASASRATGGSDGKSGPRGSTALPGDGAGAGAGDGGRSGELELETVEEVLKRHGFSAKMFEMLGRDPAENLEERDRFAARVLEWRNILEHPVVK